MSWRSIFTWLAFQVVWLVCAVGAANGVGAPGIASALALTAVSVAGSGRPLRDALLAAAGGAAGLALESALFHAGVLRFGSPWPVEALAPAWIVALWIAFGATLPAFIGGLGAHRVKAAAVLGFVAGPLAYLAGARLGALEILWPLPQAFLVIAVMWAAVLAGMVMLYGRFER